MTTSQTDFDTTTDFAAFFAEYGIEIEASVAAESQEAAEARVSHNQMRHADSKMYRCYFQRVQSVEEQSEFLPFLSFYLDIADPDFAALRMQSEPMFLYAEPIS